MSAKYAKHAKDLGNKGIGVLGLCGLTAKRSKDAKGMKIGEGIVSAKHAKDAKDLVFDFNRIRLYRDYGATDPPSSAIAGYGVSGRGGEIAEGMGYAVSGGGCLMVKR